MRVLPVGEEEAAINLANLSGESRGADADAWREWLRSLHADVVAPDIER